MEKMLEMNQQVRHAQQQRFLDTKAHISKKTKKKKTLTQITYTNKFHPHENIFVNNK